MNAHQAGPALALGDRLGAGAPYSSLRVAIVHDYLTQRGGAERVVLAMLKAFPDARLVTSVYNPATTYPGFMERLIETSSLQRLPAFRRDPRKALPFLSATFSGTTVRDVDLVLCSSSGWAHGVTTSAPKLVYCHNPPRWVYQHSDYVEAQSVLVRAAFKLLRPALRGWDKRAAATADRYLTTSSVVQERIQRFYGIEAGILPPPVGIDVNGDQQPIDGMEDDFFLVVGRARGYKNVQTTSEAFERMPGQRLVVVGGLPDRPGGDVWPANLRGVQDIPDSQLRWLYRHCRAVLATSNEDFGLTPLEGNAFGKPALVLRAGGFLDTLVEGVTGYYIDRLDVGSVQKAVRLCLESDLDSVKILEHAERYNMEAFVTALRREAHDVVAQNRARTRAG